MKLGKSARKNLRKRLSGAGSDAADDGEMGIPGSVPPEKNARVPWGQTRDARGAGRRDSAVLRAQGEIK